jgi:tetratricopeptide (TPR) repeat protein
MRTGLRAFVAATVLPLLVARSGMAGQGYTPEAFRTGGTFVSSCAGTAAADVQSGVTLLLLLEPDEARLAFERAEAADPDCAIASWGRALAWLDLPDGAASELAQAPARASLGRARAVRSASPRERAYIEAAVHLLEPPSSAYPARLSAFFAASLGVARQFPEDPTATLITALASLARSTVPGDMGQREAAALIAIRFGEAPQDVAAALLLALARDNARDAPGARAAAETVLKARPPSPRALQVAARIFHRLGAWDEAVAAGQAAIVTAGGVDATWLLHGAWSDHPLPWLIDAEAARGGFAAARQHLAAASARVAAAPASMVPEEAWRLRAVFDLSWFHLRWALADWRMQLQWPDPALSSFPAPTPPPPEPASGEQRRLYAEVREARALVEGLVAARAAWPRAEPERLAVAREQAAALGQLSREGPLPPRAELARTLVLAAVSAALEARDELALLLAQAEALQQRVDAAGGDRLFLVDTAQMAAELRAQLRDWPEALRGFQAVAAARPASARAWLGVARAASRLGQGDVSRAAYARVVEIWQQADEAVPEFKEAKAGR